MPRFRPLGFALITLFAAGCAVEHEEARASGSDEICVAGVGDCAPPPPSFACASDLGRRFVGRAWRANFDAGTVPRELAYGAKNAADGPYVDAIHVFPKMADLIADAEREVDFESYEWGPWELDLSKDDLRRAAAALAADPSTVPSVMRDPTALVLSGLVRLEDRLREGEAAGRAQALPVRVNVSIDGAKPGSPISSYTAVSKIAKLRRQLDGIGLDPRYVEVHTAAHGALVAGAAHSKLLVVDGRRALVTGANPQQQQTVGGSWHDAGYVIDGQAAIGLQRSFDTMWTTSSEVVSCAPGDAPACDEQPTRPIPHAAEVARPNLDADAALGAACLPVFVATRRPAGFGGGLATANPLDVSSPMDQSFLALLGEAASVVKIESPNLNAPAVKKAIVAAARRGVHVRVILSLGFNTDAERKLGGSNQDTVRELSRTLARDASCENVEIRWYSADGRRPTWANEVPGASHAKYMSADGQLVMVGSGNQDLASWGFAYESNVVVDDAATTTRWDAAMFDADWARAVPVAAWAEAIRGGAAVTKDGGAAATDADLAWLLGDDRDGWLADVAGACRIR